MKYLSVNTVSISVDFVRAGISRVPLSASEIRKLLHLCRISPSLLDEPLARVSLQQYARLTTELIKSSDDELLGHGHVPLPVGSLSILTHWLVAADTMGQVLHRFERFYQILGKGIDIRVQMDGDLFHVDIGSEYHPAQSDIYIYEFAFFCIHRILCWLRKDIFPVNHLYLPFAAPNHARDYHLMFYSAPTSFNSPTARISFSRELLEKPVLQNQEGLVHLLSDPFTNLLVLNFYGESWSSRVGNHIQNNIQDMPTLPVLAESMRLPPYTLQRRLADEGVTYLAIKNQVKRDAAIEMLVYSNFTIEEISARLGFSETSPFTRTFKDWTGVPPSAYRKRQ